MIEKKEKKIKRRNKERLGPLAVITVSCFIISFCSWSKISKREREINNKGFTVTIQCVSGICVSFYEIVSFVVASPLELALRYDDKARHREMHIDTRQ